MICLATHGYLAVTESALQFNWWYAVAALVADVWIANGSPIEIAGSE